MTTLEVYFDFLSPYTYLATTQLDALAARTSAQVTYTPFRILELMKLVGNRPTTVESANKRQYANGDLGRWAKRYGIPVNPHPNAFKFDHAQFGRGAIVAAEQGRAGVYVHTVLRAIWGVPVDLTDRDAFVGLLDGAGFDGAALLEAASQPGRAEQLEENTRKAAERGAFGSPTFFVGKEMFFGNDRLDFVEAALTATPAAA